MNLFRIDFDAGGKMVNAGQRDAFLSFLQRVAPPAVLFVAHGWLNDREASGRLFSWFAQALAPLAVCGAAWPSHPFKANTAGVVRAGLEATSYYLMKERAAEVGAAGLAPLAAFVRAIGAGTAIHFAGHSFGARLVTAAAMALGRMGQGGAASSVTLLQGAFSQFSFSPGGLYRPLVEERMVRGPILVTHSRHDAAVGQAYPVASRLRRQNASALGGPDDPYGGLGANGAQGLSPAECIQLNLGDLASLEKHLAYPVINLNANKVIFHHSDLFKPQISATVRLLTGRIAA